PNAARLAELDKLLSGGKSGARVAGPGLGEGGQAGGPGASPPHGGSGWVYGAPAKLTETTTVGSVRMGVSTAGLDAELAKALADADERAHATRDRLLLIALSVLGIGVLAAALQGVGLARPIRVLTGQANKIAGGDLSSRVPE